MLLQCHLESRLHANKSTYHDACGLMTKDLCGGTNLPGAGGVGRGRGKTLHYIWNSIPICPVLFPNMGHNKSNHCSKEIEQQVKREQKNENRL